MAKQQIFEHKLTFGISLLNSLSNILITGYEKFDLR